MHEPKTLFDFAGVTLDLPDEITQAVDVLASSPAEDRGAVFTRPEIVAFILDLAGYTSDQPLIDLRVLEPSFGNGDFLLPLIDRLLSTVPKTVRQDRETIEQLSKCLVAVELHYPSFEHTCQRILDLLVREGFAKRDSKRIVDAWLVQGDYLLTSFDESFNFVVGNPPYLRQEKIPEVLLSEYRRRFQTIYDRADLYIPFIEHSLKQLARRGKLCFICADRWMKNRYGGPLRKLIADSYRLVAFASITGVEAFHDDVTAYPAITLISNERAGVTRVASINSIDAKSLSDVSQGLTSSTVEMNGPTQELDGVMNGTDAWLLEPSTSLQIVRRLEASFLTLEAAGCKVGIGVATGADRAYIALFDALDFEDSRKLRLATTDDIKSGQVLWTGQGIINPFEADGSLASLERYPRFHKYILSHKDAIAGRHVAKKSPANWYRTIDRIYPELSAKPKLLIPDIKGTANIVYEPGELYPHHNLYYITSDEWDLLALRTVLLSGIANLFVSSYTAKMRGGYFRFQAQYLRKIRLPRWSSVPPKSQKLLIEAGFKQSSQIFATVGELYGISEAERLELGWSVNHG